MISFASVFSCAEVKKTDRPLVDMNHSKGNRKLKLKYVGFRRLDKRLVINGKEVKVKLMQGTTKCAR